ncbi:MAG: acyltransferase [Bacteroidetes bacterium]|nr:acyltransferase [Bacteroidota bacterium]
MSQNLKSPEFDYAKLKAVGTNTFISANVEIRRPHLVSVGNNVAIDSGFYLTTQAQIGDYIHIAPYITCIGGEKGKLIMEDFTTIAAGCRLICSGDHHLGAGLIGPTIPDKYRDDVTYGNITLKRFASVGTNCVIMPGVILAEGSVLGACSMLTKDTEPWTIYVGTPAKAVKIRSKEKMIQYAKELGYL